jgi:HAD superfamily hydrolase (TIGR01509 family)
MLKALIFDVDGTIAETEEAHRQAFNRAFIDFGLDWRWGRALYCDLLKLTGGRERLHEYLSGLELPPTVRRNIETRIPELHAHKTALYGDMIRAGAGALRPGVARLAGEARNSGVALAIATTTSPVNLPPLFEATWSNEALDWFSVIAAGDMVKDKKPAPDIYKLALDRLGLAPDECIALEDSRNGLVSAVGAGIPTVITVNGFTAHESFEGALAVISDMGEPETPFTPVGGFAEEPGVLTLELLRRWCARLHTV